MKTDCSWRLIKALNDVAERGESMPPAHALAGRLAVSVASIHRALDRLVAGGLIECLVKGGGTRTASYRLTGSGAVLPGAEVRRPWGSVKGAADRSCAPGGRVLRQAQDEARGEQAVRKCLRCADTFLSAHRGNRICDSCKSHTEFNPGGEIYRVALS